MIVSRLQVTCNASPVTLVNYYRKCAKKVWCPWYLIPSNIWFQVNFWEASSPGFQNSFSMAWFLQEVLASIPWYASCDCFRDFDLPVSEYCSAVCSSAVDTHLKLLDRVVSGANFLTGFSQECRIAHCRSVVVLCMLFKIMCNPMHPSFGALLFRLCQCGLHAVAVVAQCSSKDCTYEPPRCRTLPQDFCSLLFVFYFFPFFFFLFIGWYCVAGVFGLIGCQSLSFGFVLSTIFNNSNNNE